MKQKILQFSRVEAIKEGYDQEGRVVTEGDIFYGKLDEFALHQCTFYECSKCDEIYFGGMQDCAEAMEAENAEESKEDELLCKKCRI